MSGLLGIDYKHKIIKDIVRRIEVVYYNKGEIVYKEGDIDDSVYFIYSGNIGLRNRKNISKFRDSGSK